jgi:tetratricopeptide (TPR) repeat protein
MISVRRLTAVGALLALAAASTTSHVWGEPNPRDQELQKWRANSATQPPKDRGLADELLPPRFANQPAGLYQSPKGETYFFLQLKPALKEAPSRPRDYVIVLDSSASKAQGPFVLAKSVAEALILKLRPEDRFSLWTVSNTPRTLTDGLVSLRDLPDAPPGKDAAAGKQGPRKAVLRALDEEYPAGATDLKAGLTKAIGDFARSGPGRQRVLLFLGDGKSLAGPLSADDRDALSDEMVKREAAFFAVPLGLRLDPQNLHGLASGTGGTCVRVEAGDQLDQFFRRLSAALDVPVLYPHTLKLPAEVAESYPSRLPPLRADAPTLVVGKLAKPAEALRYELAGTVAGRDVTLPPAEVKVPAADDDNFFLANMVAQWHNKPDRPALIEADRALTYAFERSQLARADLIARADLAADQDKFDVAKGLYEQALSVDPHSVEAKSGAAFVDRLRGELERRLDLEKGKPTGKDGKPRGVKELADGIRKELRKDFEPNKDDELTRLSGGKAVKIRREQLVLAQAPAEPVPQPRRDDRPPGEAAPPDILREQQARRQVAEQQQTQAVDEAVREANRLVQTDPNAARDLLKRARDNVLNNPDISERARAALAGRLERNQMSVERVGAVVLRNQAEALALRAAAEARATVGQLQAAVQDRIRERMRVFHDLMNEARELEASRQALAIRQDLVAQGQPVPPAVTAAYIVGLNAYNVREMYELRRIKEERFMATLLQVERSSVPFPDEPPVEYPPAAAWRALTERRKARYEASEFGPDAPRRMLELRDALSRPIRYKGLNDPAATLQEALDQLEKDQGVQFDINEKAFNFEKQNGFVVPEGGVGRLEVAKPEIPPMNATLGTVLRKILNRVPVPSGATYIIRRDTIEITTGTFATAEKALRVYPVGDLVLPIPNSINQQTVTQTISLFGFAGSFGFAGAAATFGGALGALGLQLGGLGVAGLGVGGLGALGALGAGALGALGAGGLGALGALGAGALGALGAGGLGALGQLGVGGVGGAGIGGFQAAGGFQGQFQGGFQGATNLGVGGGQAGLTGGQLGQFGNLGGQFGLQGGTQERILITLIRQVVGTPKDWAPQFDPITGRPVNQLEEGDTTLTNGENNQIGYFPPSLALVVKGTSRFQTRPISPISVTTAGGAGGGMGAAPAAPRGDALARGGPGRRDAAPGGAARPGNRPGPGGDQPPLDARAVWQDALARAPTEPGLVIATADFLAMNQKWDHAAEFLKAVARQGVVVQPWVYQSLAVALRESGGSADEIERAETSALDLEPADARAYLKAAKALAKDKRYDRAVALCRQAAALEPNVPYPYAEALTYADLARDRAGMEWAAGNLLKQDWPVANGPELQTRAAQKVEALARAFEASGRWEEGKRLKDTVRAERRRDLVIKLSWQGQADLDLKVKEPTGSVCSALNRQTVGGGTLVGDLLTAPPALPGAGALYQQAGQTEVYQAAQAFPGEYQVRVDRVWGRPLGDKAQLRVIQHQGTPQETEQVLTVDLRSGEPVTVRLADGRRTEAAAVPPPGALAPAEPPPALDAEARGQLMTKLRQMADPEVTDVDDRGFRGGAGSLVAAPAAPKGPAKDPAPRPDDRTVYATKIASFVKSSVDVVAQAQLAADRRSVRVSVAPVFGPAGATLSAQAVIVDPLLPGAPR